MTKGFDVNLDNCHEEPIHIPGSIQSYGYLLVVDPKTLTIKYCSENVSILINKPLNQIIDASLSTIITKDIVETLIGFDLDTAYRDFKTQQFTLIDPAGQDVHFDVVFSFNSKYFLVELVETNVQNSISFDSVKDLIRLSLQNLAETPDLNKVFSYAVSEVKRVTSFDRVMLYKFDAQYNGEVIAEAKEPALNSFLKQHFPESDIPKQARELYLKNPLRLLADVDAPVSMIYPNKESIDLSHGMLRSVSPVHCQYLKNMGVNASMSISVIVSGKLWGLIACHHYSPHIVSVEHREVALYLGLMLSYIISLKTQSEIEHRESMVRKLSASVSERMAENIFFLDGLRLESDNVAKMLGASGVAWRLDNIIESFGDTPSIERIDSLFKWATVNKKYTDDIYSTHQLSDENSDFNDISDLASGVFIMRIMDASNLFIMWFRKEVEQTKNWGGKPEKVIEFLDDGSHRLMPRSSFRLWQENVKNKSVMWEPIELSCALRFRNTVLNYVLSKSERIRKLNEVLEAKVVTRTEELNAELTHRKKVENKLKTALRISEDSNRELERFAFVASHDLQEPLRKIQSFGGRLLSLETDISAKGSEYLTKVIDSAERMQKLIKGVLSFSRISNTENEYALFDFDDMLKNVVINLSLLIAEKKATMKISTVGKIYGDKEQLERVVQNIVHNALKFARPNIPPIISIVVKERNNQFLTISFSDNGIGFEDSYASKIFGLFERLDIKSTVKGTGLGLAICRRIVNKHGGRIWTSSAIDEGATFYITLPLGKLD